MLSWLDYCNATHEGHPATHIVRIQRIEYKTMQPDLSSKIQKDNISHRFSNNYTGFRFKHVLTTNLLHLVFDTLMGSLPQYFSSTLDTYQPSRSLKLSNGRFLRALLWKLKYFGYRSFSYQGPVVWNSLPTDLRFSSSQVSFKYKLKHNICSRNTTHYAEITISYVTGHTAVLKDVDVIQPLLLILLLFLCLLLLLLCFSCYLLTDLFGCLCIISFVFCCCY